MSSEQKVGKNPRVDEPSNVDFLGIDNYISGIAEFINNTPTPMTIALQGDWGTGKSTILKLIEDKLKEEKFKNIVDICWFNVWEYSQFNGDENLSIMFLNYLINAITGKNEQASNKEFRAIFSGILKMGVKYVSGGASDGDFFDEILKTGDKDIYATLKDKLRTELYSRISSKEKRIVVYIDDLDRLEPKRAVEILEVIKNFLDLEGIVFVLAIDSEIVESGIKEKYQGIDDDKAKKFFEKIIQVPFRIPIERYSMNMNKFLKKVFESFDDNLFNIKDIEDDCILYINYSIGPNPRAIKRLLNLYYLYSCINKTHFKDKQKKKLLIMILCLQTAHKNIYHQLYELINNEDDNILNGIYDIIENLESNETGQNIEDFLKKMKNDIKGNEDKFKEILEESSISDSLKKKESVEMDPILIKYLEDLKQKVKDSTNGELAITFGKNSSGAVKSKEYKFYDIFPIYGIKEDYVNFGIYIDAGVKSNNDDRQAIIKANQKIYDILLNNVDSFIQEFKLKYSLEDKLEENKIRRDNNDEKRSCKFQYTINNFSYKDENLYELQQDILSFALINLNQIMCKNKDNIKEIYDNLRDAK